MNNKKNTRIISNDKSNKEDGKNTVFSIKTAELQIGNIDKTEEAFDDGKLSWAKMQWYLGDWEALASMELGEPTSRQYGLLCLMKAAGLQQTGDFNGTFEFATLAQKHNVDDQLLKQILVGGLYQTLARVHTIRGKYDKAEAKIRKGMCLVKQVEDVESGIMSRYARELSTFGSNDLAIGMIKQRLPKKISALRPSELSKRLDALTFAMSSLKSKSNETLATSYHQKMITPGDVLLNRAEQAVIIIAGMRHSGSTALFNIVRIASELSGLSVKGDYSEKIQSTHEFADSNQILLIKTHEYRDDIANMGNFILTTIRDLRDTVASAKRRKFAMLDRVGGAVEYAKYNRSIHDVWSQKSDFVFEYEVFMNRPFQVIQQILVALELDPKIADEIYKRVISLPTDDYELTLLSDTHVTDPKRELSYTSCLGPAAILKIEQQHQGWLASYGYTKLST